MKMHSSLACLAILAAAPLACGEPESDESQKQRREQGIAGLKEELAILGGEAVLMQSSSGRALRGLRVAASVKMENTSGAVTVGGVAYDPKSEAQRSWVFVHQKLQDANARVDKTTFVQHWVRFPPMAVPAEKKEAYESYLGSLFDTGAAMMLPAEKKDLGKHCFGYASLLVAEFYGDKPLDQLQLAADERPGDSLAALRAELDSDWDGVSKDGAGRVTLSAFTDYLLNKYSGKVPSPKIIAFRAFLKQTFESGLAMMLPKAKSTLGGHCFRYAALMAGEYYFDGSGRDVLGLTK